MTITKSFKHHYKYNYKKTFSFLSICMFSYTGITLHALYKKPESDKLNIVFDLDETLITSKKKSKMEKSNLENKGPFIVTNDNNYYVWPRPFVVPVVHYLSYFANVYVFTRATKDYTDDICQKVGIDKYIKGYFYRDQCDKKGKNLTKINVDINKSILIDNLSHNKFDDQHFYHIPEYEPSNLFDIELLKVLCHITKRILLNY